MGNGEPVVPRFLSTEYQNSQSLRRSAEAAEKYAAS